MSHRARPPLSEPVKPTAWMPGCLTNASPTPAPKIMLNTPAGMQVRSAARINASATRSAVAMCPLWALNTTGQPAAKAAAVSPPAVEKARGKLLAPNTATGPTPMRYWRRSGRGSGVRAGNAWSMRAPWKSPRRNTWANRRICALVRPRSPWIRALGSAVSWQVKAMKSSPRPSSSSAIASRNSARRTAGRVRNTGNAALAAATAASTSARVAWWKACGRRSPVWASTL
ncbi:hypothetical protein D3C80_1251850 [compost metagenome]